MRNQASHERKIHHRISLTHKECFVKYTITDYNINGLLSQVCYCQSYPSADQAYYESTIRKLLAGAKPTGGPAMLAYGDLVKGGYLEDRR